MKKAAFLFGAIFGFSGIILGAMGAHALEGMEPAAIKSFETGVRYQMWHAILLLVLGLLAGKYPGIWINLSIGGTIGGILLFSGSIFLYRLGGIEWIRMVTPFGGMIFIISWILLIPHFLLRKEI